MKHITKNNYQIYRFINHFFNKHIMKKVFLMLAVVAMASCSKSELSERPVVAGDVEIKAGSTVLGIESRAPYEGETSTLSTYNLTAHVLASTTQGTYKDGDASWWGESDITFTDANAKGFNTPLYYPADATTPVYLFGYYPTTGWTIAPDGLSATYTIDGKSDIMTAATATTTKAQAQATPAVYPELSFQHHLTWLDIKVVAEEITPAGGSSDNGQAAIDAWGAITGIELVKGQNNAQPANSCTVTFDTNNVAFNGTGAIPFYGIDASGVYQDYKVGEDATKYITLTPTETKAAYAIVAPITFNTGDKLSLKVKSEKLTGGTDDIEVPLTMTATGTTAGKKITITLTFKATEMQVEGKVTGWTDGGSGSQIVA